MCAIIVSCPDKEVIVLFLEKVDQDFVPPLTDKVCLEDYVDKIYSKAELVVEAENGMVVGLVVIYCNDLDNKIAYVPLCGVHKPFRGKGIASSLMKRAIGIAKRKGFEVVGLHSNNEHAIRLYQKLGFTIVSGDTNVPVRYYLELKLC